MSVPIDSRFVDNVHQLTDRASINIAMHSLTFDDC